MSFIIRIIRKSNNQKDRKQKDYQNENKRQKRFGKVFRKFHQNNFDLFLHLVWKGKHTFEKYQKRESIINKMII